MKKMEIKTNAMRILERNKIPYEAIQYECEEFIDGLHTAQITGAPVEQSFKTENCGESSGREIRGDDSCKGYYQGNRLCKRRLQSSGNEKTLSNCDS